MRLQWAGNVWNNNAECAALAPTCQEYVSNNPAAFESVFWSFKSVKVYMDKEGVEEFKSAPQTPAGPGYGSVPDAILNGEVPPVILDEVDDGFNKMRRRRAA